MMQENIPQGLTIPELPGFEILEGSFHDHRFPRHSHDGLMLSLIDAGAQKISHKGVEHVGTAGQVIAMVPHEVHAGAPATENGWTYRSMTVPFDLISDLAPILPKSFYSNIVIDDDELANAMKCTFERLEHSSTLAVESALSHALNIYFKRHTTIVVPQIKVGSEASAINKAKEYLAENLSENISLTMLSHAVGMDGFRLTRAFSATVGLPPHAWHLQMRIGAAKIDLAQGHTISGTAYSKGFADQAHFTRIFKKLTGVTPGRYRKSHLS